VMTSCLRKVEFDSGWISCCKVLVVKGIRWKGHVRKTWLNDVNGDVISIGMS